MLHSVVRRPPDLLVTARARRYQMPAPRASETLKMLTDHMYALCNHRSMHALPTGLIETPGSLDSQELLDAIVCASRALVGVAARSLADIGEEVTLAQYRMLVLLCSRGPQRISDLAQLLGVNASTAVRMCDRLVAKGLARRRRMASDRRSVRAGATKAGQLLVGEVTDRRRSEIARIVETMAPESRGVFVEALRAFAESAGEVPDQCWSVGWE